MNYNNGLSKYMINYFIVRIRLLMRRFKHVPQFLLILYVSNFKRCLLRRAIYLLERRVHFFISALWRSERLRRRQRRNRMRCVSYILNTAGLQAGNTQSCLKNLIEKLLLQCKKLIKHATFSSSFPQIWAIVK